MSLTTFRDECPCSIIWPQAKILLATKMCHPTEYKQQNSFLIFDFLKTFILDVELSAPANFTQNRVFNGFEGGLKWVGHPSIKKLLKYRVWKSVYLFPIPISSLGESEKETSIGCLHTRPNQGLNLQPRLCALTGNQTRDPSVHRMMFQPTATLARARSCFSNTSCQFVMHELYFQSFPHQNSVS